MSQLSLKPLGEVWGTVKKLVGASSPALAEELQDSPFNADDSIDVLIAQQEIWQKPNSPFVPTEDSLNLLVTELIQKIQSVFGERFREIPSIQIEETQASFLAVVNESELSKSNQLGYGFHKFTTPPTMCIDQEENTIILPEKFFLRDPSSEPTVIEYPWERGYLEEVLCEELSHVLFRQLRGELRGGYINCLKRLTPSSSMAIKEVNEAVALRVKSLIALQEKSEWGIFVAADIITAMKSREPQITYRIVEKLAESGKTIRQIAMIDEIDVIDGKAMVAFDPKHPNHKEKLNIFQS